MQSLKVRSMKMGWGTVAAICVGLVAWPALSNAGEKKPKYSDPVAELRFLILRDSNGKPVRNAAVVMHEVGKHDKQEGGGVELKTDAEGKASFEGFPYGKMRVQVLAPGFQTFGADYDANQPLLEITIKLKRPGEQYSIYQDHSSDKKDDQKESTPDPNAKPQP